MDLYTWLPLATAELNLAKVGVEGSSPFARSRFSQMAIHWIQSTGRLLAASSFLLAVWTTAAHRGIRYTQTFALPEFTLRNSSGNTPLTGWFR
jgi:hypothetical protein